MKTSFEKNFIFYDPEGRLKAADLEAGLKEHIEQLLNAFNSYTGKKLSCSL
ncbi:hypothetical protein AB1K32_20485 [Metabacillus dongyingensis]|uniref:hypothetical protein n=1 Tax=Metabacillus dongyingensis TaxID=2874282 RepID=UPI003B8D26A0